MMMNFLTMLAQTPPDYGNVSGHLVIGIIGAIFSGVALLFGKKMGRKEEKEKQQTQTEITGPQPFLVEMVEKAATKDEVAELERRMLGELKKIQDAQAEERRIAREAQGKVHARSDKNAEALAELKGEMKQMSASLARLLEIATQPKGRSGN